MPAKKCCCCGLLSCFPCFSAQPDSSEIAAPPLTVIAATLSSAPPSAADPSQVNASTVMQNDSPSDVVPSSSRGIVTPSALIPTTSQTTASLPSDAPSSSTSTVPSSSTPSSIVLKEIKIRRDADAVDRGNKEADLDELKTPSSSRLPTESDYAETIMEAVKKLDKENVDGDFSDLINYISRLLDFIEEKKEGKNQSMTKAAVGSKNFLRLKDVVSEGVNKDIVTVEGKTFLMGFLKGMGMAHMVTTGFLVAASILERHVAVSANKEACLYLLKQMNILAHHVQQLQQRPALKKGMEAPIREATMLIVEASIDCCTQIGASELSRFNGEALAKFQKKFADTQAEMRLCQFDVINQIDMRLPEGQELQYPEYPKDAVGIEDPLGEVTDRLEMGSDKNAVAVMVHGFGGMGKTTLADAVFARLFHPNRQEYKYSYVRLFDTIASVPDVVKLQRCILTDLMMGEESEIPEIRRYEEGQQVIEDMLEKEAAFIYIDNVLLPDKVEQGRDALHHLLPKNMRNARKLRLLLTTRDKDAVRIRGVKPVFYRIEGLPHEKALDLFKKAPHGDSLQQLHTDQLNDLVNICEGVPKLMMVVAGFISSKKNVQQAYSAVLEESQNNWKGKIGNDMECCIFAYKNLEETLKEIFLDICVFFQGWDWETLSNIVGEEELKMLEERALVTKDVKSMTVRVHDVMLAIGLDKKGERFRFTRASDFEKFLKKDNDQLEKIKGIWSSDDSNLLNIQASKLDLMHRSLRVVILGKSTKVEGKCEKIFEELVIFRAGDSDLPFDKSKLEKFKKLKLSHLICKSEDLENLSEGSLQLKRAERGKGSIVEIESKHSELGASSTGTLPAENIREEAPPAAAAAPTTTEIETDVDRSDPNETKEVPAAERANVNLSYLIMSVREAAAAVEIETGDVNLSELSNYVSQLLNFRKKKMGNDPLKRFSKLEESPSRETNAIKGGIRGLRKTSIGYLSDFLVQTVSLGRYGLISTNKATRWSLLNEINKFSEHVQQLQKQPGLREGMKVSIREAATLIVEATLACCPQINASKFSRFLSTEELAKFEKELQKMDTHVRNQMDLCLFDAVRQPKSHFAKYPKYAVGIEKPVGIEEALHEVSKLLEWESDKNAVAVILHGIGGMGKTTLADAVFAQLFEKKTEECKFCFVRLFQDIKSTPNVIELQKSILRQLKGEEPEEIRSYEEGQKQIALMLEKEEAFIYIDNVLLPDKREQGPDALTQLLPKKMAKAKKLRLLITTRDKDAARMTMSKGVEKKFYQIQSLPKVEAETLLRNELNGNKIQLNDSQIDGIVKICGGVPALLKVLAGFINGGEGSAVQNYETLMREAKEWKGDIGLSIEQYVFAYDKLEDELKDPFLDVCSFFRGWDWKELSDIVGDTKLKRLEQRALVTLDVKSMTARVPDVILQVGLQRTEGNRFRLTTATEIEKFLDVEDLQKIKGIWASDNKDPLRIPASKLDLMSGSLRVLKLGPLTDVEGKCENKFKELVFFSAITSHLPFYVSNLKGFEKLRHLCYNPADLQNLSQMPSNLRHVDIKLNSPAFQVSSNCIQRLRNLRVLRLSNAQFKSLPQELGDMGNGLEKVSISGCQYLEELSISNCQYLEEVSISTLKSLRVLTMGRCSGLTQLAKGLGSLTSLQELDLYGCESLEALPSELGNLTSLQKLDLSRCISLKALPRSLGNLTSLQELRLCGCVSLKALPPSLGELSSLRLLDLSSLKLKELPDGFCNFSTLTELHMTDCNRLEKLPERFGEVTRLRKLIMTKCRSLQKLPESFNQLKYLEHLDLSRCSTLEELCIYFKGLSLLRVLSLEDCDKLKKLPEDFQCLTSLEVLDVRNCHKLEGKWIDSMRKMEKLQILRIEGSKFLEDRWEKIQAQQCNQSWSCVVHTEQGLSNVENLLKQFQSKFDTMLTNGKGEPLNISGLPLNTLLLVMFDGHQDFDLDFAFPFPLLENNIDDIQINFEMVYFGNRWDHLPKKVANRILGHAPANRDAEALFRSLLSLVVLRTDFDWQVTSSFQMSAKIVSGENGDKYLSCWEFFEEECGVEDFVVTKCIRYLKWKELIERPEESNIDLSWLDE